MKRFMLGTTAIILLLFSTLAAWYEGAQIYDNPWEWEHTALISNYVNGSPVMLENQIVSLDHFAYAAKFEPLFPLLMVLSFLTLVLLALQPIFKRSFVATVTGCVVFIVLFFTIAFLIGNSPTTGFQMFSGLFGTFGVAVSIYFIYSVTKLKRRVLPNG